MRTRNGAKRQEKDCDNGGQRAKKRKRVWIIFEIYTALQYITKYAEKMRENGENSQELEKYSIVYGTINYLKKNTHGKVFIWKSMYTYLCTNNRLHYVSCTHCGTPTSHKQTQIFSRSFFYTFLFSMCRNNHLITTSNIN